ncbi:GNAT family N-acetyltransferase [Mammaliicoccus sciuri]|uniref:GNAT family N-acetyltransferase n=1 Tax=Mammaliicoccus sciuri TaxID=1296 RepID=A0AB37HSZ1_MAMSC|nr:GNAT family N-acetyltransferase [Mammaliicoccus sciuri]MCD8835871.1 GNAT family N-acetyltransferase [Mammaliicoccus sciuri]MCJ0939176.1 GNAT family N-acetyltransferase [Mammaliicoccus sciuri]MCJ0964323.1 GNAT family N-acetyltransferase [Mammaliicoccus sciuri]MEB6226471.1 GNAT family N-acetyltransferase [Mammaliicoccus sciuri]QRN90363.1 GNAT family N-acetyltransferase [Mammaliicoccus sciuri]
MIHIKAFYNTLPELENKELSKIHNEIFDTNENLNDKFLSKSKIIIIVAYKESTIVGYKIGYEIDCSTFYSWLGGVEKNNRNHGIAQMLMDKQISIIKSKRYEKIQTKTFNKWKSMLILNIKNDFQIRRCYPDKNDLAIILEKNLN